MRGKNVWASTLEKGDKRSESGILLEEKYGDEGQWKEHFDYLLPFFKDRRYITVKGKPIFVIYRPVNIPCIREMVEFWQAKAMENGLEGLYVIGIDAEGRYRNVLDAELYLEPRSSFALWEQNPRGITKFNYGDIWRQILDRRGDARTFFGGFVSYDDTPRRGNEGKLIEGAAPDKFCHYLKELMAKNEANGNDIVFLNAWNEWGEGMYLEPDVRHQYGFLEAVSYAKKHYQSQVSYYLKTTENKGGSQTEINNIINQKNKFEHYLNLLDVWMCLRESGVKLDAWFLEKNYKCIGLYGYGTLGRHFVKELESSEIEICYLIDRQKDRLYTKVPLYLPEDVFPEVDIIVVSATFYFDEICQRLRDKGVYNIVSLEQIIEEL